MMGWNLPPGCTNADIERAINDDESPLEDDREPGSPEQNIEESLARFQQEGELLSALTPFFTLEICNEIANRCRKKLREIRKQDFAKPHRESA